MERLAPAKVNLGLSVRFLREAGSPELHTLFALANVVIGARRSAA